MFLRLKAPERAVAGVGFLASWFETRTAFDAWELLGEKNGAPTLAHFARGLGRDRAAMGRPLGNMLLRDVAFWPESRWLPWGQGLWSDTTVRGMSRLQPAQVAALQRAAGEVEAPVELGPDFRLMPGDGRTWEERRSVVRLGQGVFRARLLDAYGRRCAVTGEHTEPVLQAAHIQPYLGPGSNHVQNGVLLVGEFHTLFDRGLVAIEPPGRASGAYRVRVSRRIRERWDNGHRYNAFDGRELLSVPERAELRPSAEALAWHLEERFERVA